MQRPALPARVQNQRQKGDRVSSRPDAEQWFGLLDELDRLERQIRQQSAVVRARVDRGDALGFPSASPGFGERGATHSPRVDIDGNVIEPDPNDLPPAHADITGETAASLADGKHREDDLSRHVRCAERLTLEGVEKLRRAFGELCLAIPGPIPDPQREACSSCFASKDVVTNYGKNPKLWVQSEGKCASCSRRLARRGLSDKKAS